jgi:DNA-binding transcriptional MerR regulator
VRYLNKRELIHEVNSRGYPLTEGALRIYSGSKYRLILLSRKAKSGTSNQYSNEHVDQICEIIAANRIGVRLSEMNEYLASYNKQQYLISRILANKNSVQQESLFWSSLFQLTKEIETGLHPESNATELYLKLIQYQSLKEMHK